MEDSKYKFEGGQFVNRFSGEAIPDDEPVILFRARDTHVMAMLAYYRSGCYDEHHREIMSEAMAEFFDFGAKHPERMREPTSRSMPLFTRQ